MEPAERRGWPTNILWHRVTQKFPDVARALSDQGQRSAIFTTIRAIQFLAIFHVTATSEGHEASLIADPWLGVRAAQERPELVKTHDIAGQQSVAS